MKKIMSIALLLLFTISLLGCSPAADPKEEVNQFFNALQTKDQQTLAKYANSPYISILFNSTGGDPKTLETIYENLFKNLSYEIVSTKENKENTIIQLKITNANFKTSFTNYSKKSYDYLMKNLYTNKVTKEQSEKACLQIFANEIQLTAKTGKKITTTVEITLTKHQDGYQIELTEKFADAVSGGLVSGQKEMISS